MDVLIAELYGSQIAALDTAPDWAQSPFMDKETLSQLFKNAKSAKNEKTAKNSMVKRGDLASRVEYMLGEFSEIRCIISGSIRFGRAHVGSKLKDSQNRTTFLPSCSDGPDDPIGSPNSLLESLIIEL